MSQRFRDLMAQGPNGFALDEACLLIAAHARPSLDVGGYLSRLDELAGEILPPTLDGLIDSVFGPHGFHGNTDNYYDPANSYLDQVIDRRVGIPITLAVVAMEVGRRAGVPLWGVSMPGHFLLRDKVDPDVFVDPFNGGRILGAGDCRRLHFALSGGSPWEDAFLNPASKLTVVARMLSNLKAVATSRDDLGMLRWVLLLRQAIPGLAEQERDEFQAVSSRFN
ncbi:MAG: transglutaminase-like domain-containing protein [Actinomycetota bacterium]